MKKCSAFDSLTFKLKLSRAFTTVMQFLYILTAVAVGPSDWRRSCSPPPIKDAAVFSGGCLCALI